MVGVRIDGGAHVRGDAFGFVCWSERRADGIYVEGMPWLVAPHGERTALRYSSPD